MPADIKYPKLLQTIWREVGMDPSKPTTRKPRSIMPGVEPPKIVNNAKYCA